MPKVTGEVHRAALLPFAFCIRLVASTSILCALIANTPAAAADGPAVEFPLGPRIVGAAGCSAAACHGGNGAKLKGSEFTIWSQRDPHRQAFQTLLTERSSQMAERLRLPQPAHQTQMCLDCHATTDPTALREIRLQQAAFGVSCESCHGPAEHWLRDHPSFDPSSPLSLTSAEQARGSLSDANRKIDTTDLVIRGGQCVKCHVGEAGREVTHEMIAAGHPRLMFEFSAAQAVLPKHWLSRATAADSRPRDLDRHPDFEIHAWSVGRLVTARAALQLVADRSSDAEQTWPEFADYQCYACHHGVSQRHKPAEIHAPIRLGQSKGPWRWSGGATFPWRTGSSNSDGTPSTNAADHWQALQTLLQEPTKNRRVISRTARAAVQDLDSLIADSAALHWTPNQVRERTAEILRTTDVEQSRWEEIVQTSLELRALVRTQRDFHPSAESLEWEAAVEALVQALQFSRQSPPIWDSPLDYGPDKIAGPWKYLQRLLNTPAELPP